MAADVELYEDPAGLPYDGLVAAWHEVESRSAWFKARLAAAVLLGQLERFAKDVGAAYATVTHYRSVANAYPAAPFGRPKVSFGVAAALMAHPHRFELVSREKPLTVREARKLAKPEQTTGKPGKPHADLRGKLDRGKPGKPLTNVPEPEPEPQVSDAGEKKPVTNVPAPPTVAGQEPGRRLADSMTTITECPGCRSKDELISDLGAKLETAHEQIGKLKAAHPDAVLMAERDAIAADRDRLAARVAELEAKLSALPIAAEQAAPPTAPQPEPETADSAHGNGQAPSEPRARRGARTTCGAAGTGKFRFVAGGRLVSISMPPDGRKAGELWLCGEHQEEMTERLGAEVDLDPAGDGGYDFDEPCQFPVRAEVPA